MKNWLKKTHLLILLSMVALMFACGGESNKSEEVVASEEVSKSEEVSSSSSLQNVLTAEEEQNGWKLLFDGKTLQGWRGFQNQPLSAWAVEDECIARVGDGVDIMTQDQYENFELKLEWKISPEGNSGIFFHVVEGDHKTTYETAPEMQIIDASAGRYAGDKTTPKQKAGANYDLHPVDKDYAKPVGEFNQVHIICNNGKVQYFLNGEKTADFEMWTPEWNKLVKESKFGSMKGFAEAKTGYIALQNHGDKVWFRNIKIKTL